MTNYRPEVICHCNGLCVFKGDIGNEVEEWKCEDCGRLYKLHHNVETMGND